MTGKIIGGFLEGQSNNGDPSIYNPPRLSIVTYWSITSAKAMRIYYAKKCFSFMYIYIFLFDLLSSGQICDRY